MPAEAITADLSMVKQYFVDAFPRSKTRAGLFANFENYISRLQNEVFPWFEMWVDGSFVTLKENPNDIDVVTLLDYQVFDWKEKTLDHFYSFKWEREGIDAYFIRDVPPGTEGHQQSLEFRRLWRLRYSNAPSNFGKGFLTLVFKNEVK